MGDIGTFDAQWGLLHAQSLLNILQSRRPGGEVSHPLELVLAQLLLGVFLHRGHELFFIAALGNAQVHLGTAQFL